MYNITDLKKDTLIQLDGVPYRVIEYAQKQMGRGGSIVNTKLKNLLDGSLITRTFKGSDKIEPANVANQTVQFLYKDNKALYFMDRDTYEQFEVSQNTVGAQEQFLKEGQTITAKIFGGRVINIELPLKVTLQVTQADPGLKGDSVSNVMKSCVVETGARIQVPLFIKPGNNIVIDTRDGSYVERKR